MTKLNFTAATTGRFSCSVPNLSVVPASKLYHPETKLKTICAAYPGKDGIGADIEELIDESCSDGSEIPSNE